MKTFEELGIKKSLKYLQEAGFTEPFPIQEQAIPILLAGKDMIGQAQTGTGKTAAFGLPILEGIDEDVNDTQALIIVPTRELAMQVADEMRKFSGNTARVTAVYGGESMMRQIQSLRHSRQIVVATPGRMLDYIREDVMKLNRVRFVVLDEADRMLDMGFIDDVKDILRNVPEERQTSMFSATMPPAIMRLTHDFMKNPEKIIVSKDEISNVNVKQYYMELNDRDKLNHLCSILKDNKKTIVFCAAKSRVRKLADELYRRGFEVEAIHGDMEQPQRTRVINDFKLNRVDILVATDVVARGIDVPTVERVISYDVPQDALVYFHRIGRTARASKTGSAIIFVTNDYRNEFNSIRNETNIRIEKIFTPSVQEFPVVRSSYEKNFGAGGRKFGGSRKFSREGGVKHGFDRDMGMHRRTGESRHGKFFRGRPSRGRRQYSSRR